MSDFDRRDLVYGLDPFMNTGSLVFLPRQYAQERASEVEALKAASTLSGVPQVVGISGVSGGS